jgi:flavin-dependent dehydrogenase
LKYDILVVGARCAGAPLAMLMARSGARVLLVDRCAPGSDVINGHAIKPAGVARLIGWGIYDSVLATGAPPILARRLVAGSVVQERAFDPAVPMIAPRRFVLDSLLVEAAARAGAEVRMSTVLENLTVRSGRVVGGVVVGHDGRRHEVGATLVVGADGRNSKVARLVGADRYRDDGTTSIAYWMYWNGEADPAVTLELREGRAVGIFPTNQGSRLAFVQTRPSDAASFRADPRGAYLRALRTSSVFDLLSTSRPVSGVLGMISLPNYYRTAAGPGWALAGDAGHHKDPLLVRGISDAFRDAERLAAALQDSLGDEEAELMHSLDRYGRERDEATLDLYQANLALSRLSDPVPELVRRFAEAAEIEGRLDSAFPPVAQCEPKAFAAEVVSG